MFLFLPVHSIISDASVVIAPSSSKPSNNNSQLRNNKSFCIRHFASDVIYTADGFTDKNVDTISVDLRNFLRGYCEEFISKELCFTLMPSTTTTPSSRGLDNVAGREQLQQQQQQLFYCAHCGERKRPAEEFCGTAKKGSIAGGGLPRQDSGKPHRQARAAGCVPFFARRSSAASTSHPQGNSKGVVCEGHFVVGKEWEESNNIVDGTTLLSSKRDGGSQGMQPPSRVVRDANNAAGGSSFCVHCGVTGPAMMRQTGGGQDFLFDDSEDEKESEIDVISKENRFPDGLSKGFVSIGGCDGDAAWRCDAHSGRRGRSVMETLDESRVRNRSRSIMEGGGAAMSRSQSRGTRRRLLEQRSKSLASLFAIQVLVVVGIYE